MIASLRIALWISPVLAGALLFAAASVVPPADADKPLPIEWAGAAPTEPVETSTVQLARSN